MIPIPMICACAGGAVLTVALRRQFASERTAVLPGSSPVQMAGPGFGSRGRNAERMAHALRNWTQEVPAPDSRRLADPSEPAPVIVETHFGGQDQMRDGMSQTTAGGGAETPPQAGPYRESNGEETGQAAWKSEGRRVQPEARPELSADYYEILQISPHADIETIHRVYRIMAARFHPDNPKTGDNERFLALRQAYQVLTDPAQRAHYDTARQVREPQPLPIFEHKVFVDGVAGERNRRLGVLSLLYHRRRLNESNPGISMLEMERLMAFPREYLSFTMWYLRTKGYVSLLEQNSNFALTADGVDYVERDSTTNRVIRELLAAGSGAVTSTEPSRPEPAAARPRRCPRPSGVSRYRGAPNGWPFLRPRSLAR